MPRHAKHETTTDTDTAKADVPKTKKGDVDPTPKLKTTRVTFVSANTDGRFLYLEVDAFDGEHNNKFYPVFDADADAEEITKYMKELIEENPKLSPEISGMILTGIFWDAEGDQWMIQPMTGPAKPEKKDKKKSETDKSDKSDK